MTFTSTKYKHQKVNVWPKTLRGDHETKRLSLVLYHTQIRSGEHDIVAISSQ